jgi:hypothetical protein
MWAADAMSLKMEMDVVLVARPMPAVCAGETDPAALLYALMAHASLPVRIIALVLTIVQRRRGEVVLATGKSARWARARRRNSGQMIAVIAVAAATMREHRLKVVLQDRMLRISCVIDYARGRRSYEQ